MKGILSLVSFILSFAVLYALAGIAYKLLSWALTIVGVVLAVILILVG